MTLATYSDLKTSVANYLNRDDLTSVIPDFISLTENRMNRDLRVRANMKRANTTTTAGTAFYNLPSDMIELRNINNILQSFPDLYLFGSCLEGAIYLNDTEQVQRFGGIYEKALKDVRDAEDSARYSGTVMTMTVQGDPGSLVRRGAV